MNTFEEIATAQVGAPHVGLTRARVTIERPATNAASPELTELVLEAPGPKRLLHSAAYQGPWRFAGRVLEVGVEVARARLTDFAMARELSHSQIVASEAGDAPATTSGRRVALYLHYSASGRISTMVRDQLAGYRSLGFDVVLATNSEQIHEESWRAAATHCWRLVRRRNIGLDFGAWRDAAALLLVGQPPPDELLLVNDSVVGPIQPLAPFVARARMMGPGVVGLTESRQGGVHLQSYFVLMLGAAATADTLTFLTGLRLSTAKWLMVQRGEFGLTRHLARRGHRVAALFGYARALDAILASDEERRQLTATVPQFSEHAGAPKSLRQALLRWPLNPTMHLWRGLALCMGFPFVKVALLRRNSGMLPKGTDWSALIDDDPDDFAALIVEHLATLNAA